MMRRTFAVALAITITCAAGGVRADDRCSSDAEVTAALPKAGDFAWGLPGGGAFVFAQRKDGLLAWDGCRLLALPRPFAPAGELARAWAFDGTTIWGLAKKDANGPATSIVRWDGRAWQEVGSFGDKPEDAAQSVWASGRNDVWFAGGAGGSAAIVRWDGRALVRVELGAAERARGRVANVGGTGPSDVWLGMDGSGFLRWDGRRFTFAASAEELQAARPAPAGDAWAIAYGAVFAAAGSRWRPHRRPELYVRDRLEIGFERAASAGNQLFVTTTGGRIWSPDGQGGWREAFAFRSADFTTARRGVAGWGTVDELRLASPRRGFGFGRWNQTLVALRFDGDAWTAMGNFAAESVTSVAASGRDEAWATTSVAWRNGKRRGGAVLRWDGRGWRRVAEAASPLLAIAAFAPGEAWAVGEAGAALRCTPGGCAPVPTGTDEALVSAWSAGGQLWGGGSGGSVLAWDGRALQRRAPPRGWTLTALWSAGPESLWAAGGAPLRWTGRGWATPGEMDAQLGGDSFISLAVAGTRGDDVWVAGSRHSQYNGNSSYAPMLFRWDGKAWTGSEVYHARATSRRATITHLGTSGGRLWAAGEQGLLWRRGASDWERLDSGISETIWSVAVAGDDVWVAAGDAPLPRRIRPQAPPP